MDIWVNGSDDTVDNRQGVDPLSPRSFALFLERIMDKIKNRENSGVSVNGNRVNNLRFADDIDIMDRAMRNCFSCIDTRPSTVHPPGVCQITGRRVSARSGDQVDLVQQPKTRCRVCTHPKSMGQIDSWATWWSGLVACHQWQRQSQTVGSIIATLRRLASSTTYHINRAMAVRWRNQDCGSTQTRMQSVRAPFMCMRQSSWCTGPAWLGLPEKCIETATP